MCCKLFALLVQVRGDLTNADIWYRPSAFLHGCVVLLVHDSMPGNAQNFHKQTK